MDKDENITTLIKEKYLKVNELIKKKDPETSPYESCYEARKILIEMKELLEEDVSKLKDTEIRHTAKLGGIYYLLGTLYMKTEETAAAEEHLLKSFQMIDEYSCHSDNILCALACLNQIGLLYANLLKNEDALIYLEKAMNIYQTFNNQESPEEPLLLSTMYAQQRSQTVRKGFIILERTHTLSLYYLAQVYAALGDKEKGALYCHETLRRQIESNDYKHIEWAINVATMSQVLLEKNAFKEARHHLAAAIYILQEYEKNLCNEEISAKQGDEQLEAINEELCRTRSDVMRCWIKYCIGLLTFSKERLMTDDETSTDSFGQPPKEILNLKFPTLLSLINEEVIPCTPLLTYEDARPVFLYGRQCCEEAIKYYTLTEHATDYASIALDHSQLYQCLAFFEENEDNQCKMLKRRLDILKNVVTNLNPNYYLDICREIWLSIAQVCTDMADMKTKKATSTGDPTLHQITKVNTLVEEGNSYYAQFIESFIDKRTCKLPTNYPKEHEQLLILANLQAARLHSKYLRPDKSKCIENDRKSIQYCQTIVDYAKSHENIKEEMSSIVQIAQDMLLLLPYRVSRFSQINK